MDGGSMAEADALALLAIARRDLQAAQGIAAVWGFQVQQTIEKSLKAWLYLCGLEQPFTHDLVALLKLLQQANIDTTPSSAISEVQRQPLAAEISALGHPCADRETSLTRQVR